MLETAILSAIANGIYGALKYASKQKDEKFNIIEWGKSITKGAIIGAACAIFGIPLPTDAVAQSAALLGISKITNTAIEAGKNITKKKTKR